MSQITIAFTNPEFPRIGGGIAVALSYCACCLVPVE